MATRGAGSCGHSPTVPARRAARRSHDSGASTGDEDDAACDVRARKVARHGNGTVGGRCFIGALPMELIVHIMSFLPVTARLNAAAVCRTWRLACTCAGLWRSVGLGHWLDRTAWTTQLHSVREHLAHTRSLDLSGAACLPEVAVVSAVSACTALESLAIRNAAWITDTSTLGAGGAAPVALRLTRRPRPVRVSRQRSSSLP